jgi:hypothetical protein
MILKKVMTIRTFAGRQLKVSPKMNVIAESFLAAAVTVKRW